MLVTISININLNITGDFLKQYVMNVEPALIKKVDLLVKQLGEHSSRNDFIRDAIRSKIAEFERAQIRKDLKKLAQLGLKRGWNGEMPTQEQRDKIAKEALREDGFLVD